MNAKNYLKLKLLVLGAVMLVGSLGLVSRAGAVSLVTSVSLQGVSVDSLPAGNVGDSVSRIYTGRLGLARSSVVGRVIISGESPVVNSTTPITVGFGEDVDSVVWRKRAGGNPVGARVGGNTILIPSVLGTGATLADGDTVLFRKQGGDMDSIIFRRGAKITSRIIGWAGGDSILVQHSGIKKTTPGVGDSITQTGITRMPGAFWNGIKTAAGTGVEATTTKDTINVSFVDTTGITATNKQNATERTSFTVKTKNNRFATVSLKRAGAALGASSEDVLAWEQPTSQGDLRYEIKHGKPMDYAFEVEFKNIAVDAVTYGSQSLAKPGVALDGVGDSVSRSTAAKFGIVRRGRSYDAPGSHKVGNGVEGVSDVVIAEKSIGGITFGTNVATFYAVKKKGATSTPVVSAASSKSVTISSLEPLDSVFFFKDKAMEVGVDTAVIYRGTKATVNVAGATLTGANDRQDSVRVLWRQSLHADTVTLGRTDDKRKFNNLAGASHTFFSYQDNEAADSLEVHVLAADPVAPAARRVANVTVTIAGKTATRGVDYAVKARGSAAGSADTLVIPVESGTEVVVDVQYRQEIAENAINVPRYVPRVFNWDVKTLTDVTPTSPGTGALTARYTYWGKTGARKWIGTQSAPGGGSEWKDSTESPTGPKTVGEYAVLVEVFNASYYGSVICTLEVLPKPIGSVSAELIPQAWEYNGLQQSASPRYVIDVRGAARDTLILDRDYEVDSIYNGVNAGTATWSIKGKWNFDSTSFKTVDFQIAKKPIAVVGVQSEVGGKLYDGSSTVPDSLVSAVFTGLVSPQTLTRDSGYVIVSAVFENSNGTVTTASGRAIDVKVALGDDTVASNYILPDSQSTFRKTGVKIDRITDALMDTSHLSFVIPDSGSHRYTGTARGIGAVTFKSPRRNTLTAAGGPDSLNVITVLYNDSIAPPVKDTAYVVTARIKNGVNYDSTTIELGTYYILPAAAPVVSVPTTPTEVRQGRIVRIGATATSPNNGALSYRWYQVVGSDTVRIATAATDSAYTPSTALEGSYDFRVLVTNTVAVSAGVSEVARTLSGVITLNVIEPAIDISTASVYIGAEGTYKTTYTGTDQVPPYDSVTVVLANAAGTLDTLISIVDYTITATRNVNAGNAVLRVTGLDRYDGIVTEQFAIEKRQLRRTDLELDTATRVYSGVAHTPVPKLKGSLTGLGAVTTAFEKDGLPVTELVDVGNYSVKVTVEAGTNFLASTSQFELDDEYVITKKVPAAGDLVLGGVAYTGGVLPGAVADGTEKGVGEVTLKGTGYGTIGVTYTKDGGAALPLNAKPVDAGTYSVSITVAAGTNYEATLLPIVLTGYVIANPGEEAVALAKAEIEGATYGTVNMASVNTAAAAKAYVEGVIAELGLTGVTTTVTQVSFTAAVPGEEDEPGTNGSYTFTVEISASGVTATTAAKTLTISATVSVASNDRVIPGSGSEVVVVAPVQVVAGEFTVGPNPVAKASGKVGFFWQGKAVKSGTLYVFDASGNLVTKAAVSDKGTGTDRREIGSWNLTAKGAPVTEGTYLVKGVLVGKDGSKVKVSSVLGVAR